MQRASVAIALFLAWGRVSGAEPDPALPPLVAPPPRSPQVRLSAALHRFEFGDYDGVASELESLVENGGQGLSRADRLEALRAYGIACALLGRSTAAEGAFLLLLEADASVTMDPALVRPEAVQLFEEVRRRNRASLRAAYQRGRGRRYAVLNLLPPAGQLQNHDYKKGYGLLGVELALVALDVTSGSLLYSWRGAHQDFPGHEEAAKALRPVNWVSFGALIGVALYGIIDGFVIGHRRQNEERETLKSLAGDFMPHVRSAPRVALDLTEGGVGLRF